ncbi:SAICAR synthase-like protein [Pseudovirgaria hyperparasitica]|uniref:Kinase n=1 Tax=Pseudovirgaria hyperparasitica TaxID=470096 RepID=A0A6A6VZV3_9PEZI|nr:SAICAR synthase-like protein [Pseudovirgaria hyperparasitica]KAF2755376.1 SAICAR synthase-like protein [Pseudovirgaria hyperparasitica]
MPKTPSHKLDPSILTLFGNAAAGHEGVLSDPSGELIIKPCTPAEVAFYEAVRASRPELLPFLPTFYGTLALNGPAEAVPETTGGLDTTPTVMPVEDGTAASLSANDVGPMHGKKLSTDVSIVLENTTAGFKKPNVLDIKLGRQLYEDDARPEKKARLDKVAGETTTGSLGFRVAGMRVWQGTEEAAMGPNDEGLMEVDSATNYKVYNKLYGRQFSAENVTRAFEEYLLVPSAGMDSARALAVTKQLRKDVEDIIKIFETQESRMFSASILFVYEGDPEAYDQAARAISEIMEKRLLADETGEDEDEDEEDDELEIPKLVSTKLIDFAHASFKPGSGPDENSLFGMRNTVKVLGDLERQFEVPV